MARIDEVRLQTLERRTDTIAARLAALESQLATAPAVSGRAAAAPAAPMPAPASEPPAPAVASRPPTASVPAPSPALTPAPQAPRPGLEDLLGGRVLAWTGGVAVLLGIVFLLTIAVSNGWIGEGARTLMAGLGSLALIGAGIWLHERRRRTDAALATLAAGIAGMFVTVVVGGPGYGVLPVSVALALALGAGTLATALAIRWEARGIGAVGIVGALLAPVLAGAPSTGATLAVLWVAGMSGAAVLVWQRWNWLAVAIFAVATAQWGWWLVDAGSTAGVLLVLTAFGLLNAGAAAGFELRVPAARLRASSALLLTLNALALAVAGWFALEATAAGSLPHAWLGALAVAHLVVGLATAATRINRDLRLLALALGVVLADVTAGLVLDGAVLAAAWAATTAGFGALARHQLRRPRDGADSRDETLLALGLGGHLLLSATQALMQAPPQTLADGGAFGTGAYAAIAATVCAAFVAGRFTADLQRSWRIALDSVALAGVAYLTAVTLDGPVLSLAFAAQAFALGTIAARGRDIVAAWGGGAFLGLALGHALLFEAPPDALVVGLDSVAGSALALGAAALAAARGVQLLARVAPAAGEHATAIVAQARTVLAATASLALLYLASTMLVTPFAPGEEARISGLFDLGARQLGQALLSALWAVTGLAALVAGLRRDDRSLRLGALALLLVTVGKVFLYDLAALTSLYRVGSFIVLGLLLLVAAGLWQRMRPRPLPDLRDAPPAIR